MENVGVKILLFATLRDRYGIKEIEVKCDGTVRSLVDNAAQVLGGNFIHDVYNVARSKVREDLIFTINGRNIKDMKGKIEIKDGDKISIFPPLAGG